MMTRILASALFLAAGAAAADEIELTSPMQGASLHEGGIDMVVFYLDQDDHFEVVATYAPQREPYEPSRFRLAMADGDTMRFALPGEDQVMYSFARAGTTVSVTAGPADVTQALLD